MDIQRIVLYGAQSPVLSTLSRQLRSLNRYHISRPRSTRSLLRSLAKPTAVLVLIAPLPGADERVSPLPEQIAEFQRLHAVLPIIVCDDQDDHERRYALLQAGALAVLRPPLYWPEIVLLVDRAVQGSHARVNCVASSEPLCVENMRLRAEAEQMLTALHKRERDVYAIADIAAALTSELDLSQILQQTCHAAVQIFKVDHSGMVIFDETYTHGTVVAEYPDLGSTGITIPVRGIVFEERLIAAKEPMAFSDVDKAASDFGSVALIFAELRIRSILIVPVVHKGQVIGSFSLDVIDREQVFDQQTIELCQTFAAQVAVAIEKTRLLNESRTRAEQLEILRQTTLAITSELDQGQLLQIIIQKGGALLAANRGGIYLYDTNRCLLKLVAVVGHPGELVGRTLRLGEGMAGRIVEHDEPFLSVEDYAHWPERALIFGYADAFGSVLAVPLRWKDQTIGVLFVDDEAGRRFSTDDVQLLRMFADHAAIALTNNSLAAAQATYHNQLDQLARFHPPVVCNVADVDRRQQLQQFAEQAAAIVGGERGYVLLRDSEHRNTISLVAAYGQACPVGLTLAMSIDPGASLCGAVAYYQQPFRAHGVALQQQQLRADDVTSDAAPCYSVLALPLLRAERGYRQCIGVVRVDNKRDAYGASGLDIGFSEADERLLQLLTTSVTAAIENGTIADQLSAQTKRWQQLIAHAPIGIIVNNHQGRITTANDYAARLLDTSPTDVEGQVVDYLYADPDEARVIGQLLHSGSTVNKRETMLRSHNGSCVPIRLSATHFHDEQGKVAGTIGFFEDLRLLRNAEDRLQILFNLSETIAQAANLCDALRFVAEEIVLLLNSTFCRISLLDEEDTFVVQAAVAVPRRVGQELKWSSGLHTALPTLTWPILAQELQGDTLVLRCDPHSNDDSFLVEWSRQLATDTPIKSLLFIVLRGRHKPIGLLELGEVRHWNRADFSAADQHMLSAIANQLGSMIERLRLVDSNDYHLMRLSNLDRAVRSLRMDQELLKLNQEALQLAIDIVGYSCGVFYHYRSNQGQLVIEHVFGLPPDLVGQQQSDRESIIGVVARQGRTEALAAYDRCEQQDPLLHGHTIKSAIIVPLVHAGHVQAVFLVGEHTSHREMIRIDQAVLERFAIQVVASRQIAQVLNREQRALAKVALLQHLGEFFQSTQDINKICHAFLTSITAGYGLRYNRAALCLLNERGDYLEGRMGIGYFALGDATAAWSRLQTSNTDDFGYYLKRLETTGEELTPLGDAIRQLSLPVRADNTSALLSVLRSEKARVLEATSWHGVLPEEFVALYQPARQLIVAPIIGRSQRPLGVVLADNAFNGATITDDDGEQLMMFTRTAALAIENIQLASYNAQARHHLMELLGRHRRDQATHNPDDVILHALRRVQDQFQAMWVSAIQIDEKVGEAYKLISTRDRMYNSARIVRPQGVSMAVMHSGKAEVFEHTDHYRDRLHPVIFRRGVGAAACVPLVQGEQRVGVVWIHFPEPRAIAEVEVETVQLYLQQVMADYDNLQRIYVLESIRNAAEAVVSVQGWQQVASQIAERARMLFGADSAAIYAYDEGHLLPDQSVAVGMPALQWERALARAARANGTTARVMEQGYVAVQNINDERYSFVSEAARDLFQTIGLHSFQGLSLSVGAEQLGVLYLNYQRQRSFSIEDRRTGLFFARFAALALKQARMHEAVSIAEKEVRTAHEMVQSVAHVSAIENLPRTLDSIAEAVLHLLRCDTVVIYPYDERRRLLRHVPIARGVRDEQSIARRPTVVRDSIVAMVLRRSEPLWLQEIRSEPRFARSFFVRNEQIASTAALPLRYGGAVVGALFVGYRTTHCFTTTDQKHLKLLADQAAAALRNDQLYQDSQQRISSLEAIHRAGRSVTNIRPHGDDGAVLQTTLDQIVHQAYHLGGKRARQRCFSHLALMHGTVLRFAAAYPSHYLSGLRTRLKEIDIANSPQIGIMGRAVKSMAPVRVDNVHTCPDYLEYDSHVRSELAVPIKVGSRVIGVINIEHPEECAFTEEDEQALTALADYAAVAIQNARLYERLDTVARIGREAAMSQDLHARDAASMHGIDRVLRTVCEHLEHDIFQHDPPEPLAASVRLYDEHRSMLVFDPRWSVSFEQGTADGVPLQLFEQRFNEGVCGYVAYHRKPVNIGDVMVPSADPDGPQYIALSPKRIVTRSEICVPICYGEQRDLVGVIDVQSERYHAFTDDDLTFLETLAAQLAVVIRKAREYEELRRIRGVVGGRTALAWMGMMSEYWQHKIVQHARNIRQQVAWFRMQHQNGPYSNEQLDALLDTIVSQSLQIINTRVTPPLTREEGVRIEHIDHLIRERVGLLWENDEYRAVVAQPQLSLHCDAQVQVSSEWLWRALDMVVNNAIKALKQAGRDGLSITTQCVERQVWVLVRDYGNGISPLILEQLFHNKIEKPDHEDGLGCGLLIVQAIMEAYGGEVFIKDTGPHGTIVVLALPLFEEKGLYAAL